MVAISWVLRNNRHLERPGVERLAGCCLTPNSKAPQRFQPLKGLCDWLAYATDTTSDNVGHIIRTKQEDGYQSAWKLVRTTLQGAVAAQLVRYSASYLMSKDAEALELVQEAGKLKFVRPADVHRFSILRLLNFFGMAPSGDGGDLPLLWRTMSPKHDHPDEDIHLVVKWLRSTSHQQTIFGEPCFINIRVFRS